MNGGEALVATLISRGIDTLFFVAGGTFVTVLEALSRVQNKIRSVPIRLESSAAFAADAYSAVRRKPAAVFVSRGPGACNAAIGVHTAMQGSRPMVLFIANIPRPLKGREAFQEIDYQLMYQPIAKAVLEIFSFKEVPDVTARALDLAVSGRPGPVVVTVSKDVLDGETGEPAIPRPAAPVRAGPDAEAVAEAARLIDRARHPIVVAGEMVNFEGANAELAAFAEASGAGVLTAYRQQDAIPNDHPAHFGHLSINRLPFQEKALKECDLIVGMGTRFDSVTTADYTMVRPDQKLVSVYPDAAVLAAWRADVALGSHVKPALKALAAAVAKPSAARLAWRDAVHAAEAAFARPGEIEVKGAVDMAKVIAAFNARVPADSVMVSDAGTFGRWVGRYYRFNRPGTNLGPVSGAMGYGVPGGVGAALADPSRPVFVWVGDGGFLMTGHEVATAVQENLPIKVLVCDNNCWGSIIVHQHKRFGDDWDFGTRLKSPDFATLGKGYGVASLAVRRTEEFAPALEEAIAHPGPALLHLHLDIRDVSPYAKSVR
ncbi:MAG: thiamine pyrophosphate-binding protein [Proteobacteria bacterium]|nr:thiamine pyrophosphate-binding protein [Pseudomonadota bacterium]